MKQNINSSCFFFLFLFFLSQSFISDSGLPPYGGRDDSMSDERIAHILNEASSMMKSSVSSGLQHQLKDEQQRRVHEDSHSNEDSKSPLQPCPSPFFKEQIKQTQDSCIQNQSNPHIRQEDVNPEKMARLYQEIMTRAPREAFPRYETCLFHEKLVT